MIRAQKSCTKRKDTYKGIENSENSSTMPSTYTVPQHTRLKHQLKKTTHRHAASSQALSLPRKRLRARRSSTGYFELDQHVIFEGDSRRGSLWYIWRRNCTGRYHASNDLGGTVRFISDFSSLEFDDEQQSHTRHFHFPRPPLPVNSTYLQDHTTPLYRLLRRLARRWRRARFLRLSSGW